MKIYTVDFEPVCPVGCGLIIAAENIEQAKDIARETLIHVDTFEVSEVDISMPSVIFYQSGDY